MTRAVLEAEGDRATAVAAPAIPSPSLAVPATLQASLMARLDRLGPAKEVAQIGAAIGREFSHALLAAVARKPEAELGSALDRLVQSGLLFRRGMPPHATYQFKHALVQDAAYGALLREPRRALHARIVETLESQFAEIAEGQPALLARHCTEAGLIEKAASLWGKAGERSLERSALVEATEQLTRALDQIAALPSTPALRREQIELQVALANALMHAKGYAAPETRAAEERARLLIEQVEALGEEPPMGVVDPRRFLGGELYCVQWRRLSRSRGAGPGACREEKDDVSAHRSAHCFMGVSLAWTGDHREGRAHLIARSRLYDPVEASSAGNAIWHRLSGARPVAIGRTYYGYLAFPRPRSRTLNVALRDAREISHAVDTDAARWASHRWTHICCRELCDGKCRPR